MRLILCAGFIALMALPGCNTIAGVGEDISAGARTVQRAF